MAELIFDPLQGARLILTLRQRGITDSAVLGAIEHVPRSGFVGPELADLTYEDCVLPIACGQTLGRPSDIAPMLQALRVDEKPGLRVLVIGAGSGYTMALIAALGGQVFGVERYGRLAQLAEKNLSDQGVSPIRIWHGDGLEGWQEEAPFDRVVFMGGVEEMPDCVLEQLDPSGFCLAPLRSGEGWELVSFASNGTRKTLGPMPEQIAFSHGVSKGL
jgi:protein-L-isoaspartate(D-aspartate) O-methyltransferase